MDPLSVIASVASVASVVFQVSSTLYSFVQAAKVVDETVRSLCAEVDGITRVLDGITSSLKSPSLVVAKTVAKSNGSNELWDTVLGSLADCRDTLERLNKALIGTHARSTGGRSWMRQSARQLKLSMNDGDIRTYRSQLHTHNMTLQITLQIINVHVSCTTPGLIVAELGPKIQRLTDMVSKLEVMENNQKNSEQATISQGVRILCNMDQLKRSAKHVLSCASTVYNASVAGSEFDFSVGSEYGEPLSHATMAMIHRWIPGATIEEETHEDHLASENTLAHMNTSAFVDLKPSDRDITAASQTTVVEDSLVAWSDSESEFEFEIIERLFAKAEQQYAQRSYSEAETLFRRALKRVNKLPSAKRNLPKFKNGQMRLAMACYSQSKLSDTEALLISLTRDHAATNADAVRILRASHALAQVYLTGSNYDQAESYCRKALLGRRRIHGKMDESYFDSVSLLSLIYQAKGDSEESAVYKDMVPDVHYESFVSSYDVSLLPESIPVLPSRDDNEQIGTDETQTPSHPILKANVSEMRSARSLSAERPSSGSNQRGQTDDHDRFCEPDRSQNPTGPVIEGSRDEVQPITQGIIRGKQSPIESFNELEDISAPVKSNPSGLPSELEDTSHQRSPSNHSDAPDARQNIKPKTLALLSDLLAKSDDVIQTEAQGVWKSNFTDQGIAYSVGDDVKEHIMYAASWWTSPEVILQLIREWTEPRYGGSRTRIDAKGRVVQPTLGSSGYDTNETALIAAARHGRVVIVALLLMYGANIHDTDALGRTSLHCAIMYDRQDVVQVLLDEGADLNRKCTIAGDTPLHYAVAHKKEFMIKLLLDRGAEVNTPNKFGQTPWHYSATSGYRTRLLPSPLKSATDLVKE